MLLVDPSEANSSTRNPVDFLSIANICQNLEAETGADMLISPLSEPIIQDASSALGKILLKKHIESGAILIQRKSGSDVVNFIKDFNQILVKMLRWTDQPWILTIGNYLCNTNGKLVVNGKTVGGDTGWQYWAYWGALRSWQLRGGFVDNIPRDSLMLDWYNRTVKLLNPEESVYAMPRKPSQQIIMDDISDIEMYEHAACVMAISTINNVGISKASAIADYCGNLASAIEFLSDPRNIKYRDSIGYPKGVGSKIFSNASRWLGLKHSGVGKDQFYERMVIDTVNVGEDNND